MQVNYLGHWLLTRELLAGQHQQHNDTRHNTRHRAERPLQQWPQGTPGQQLHQQDGIIQTQQVSKMSSLLCICLWCCQCYSALWSNHVYFLFLQVSRPSSPSQTAACVVLTHDSSAGTLSTAKRHQNYTDTLHTSKGSQLRHSMFTACVWGHSDPCHDDTIFRTARSSQQLPSAGSMFGEVCLEQKVISNMNGKLACTGGK